MRVPTSSKGGFFFFWVAERSVKKNSKKRKEKKGKEFSCAEYFYWNFEFMIKTVSIIIYSVNIIWEEKKMRDSFSTL